MSTVAPTRKKRYHKRSSWACDECKLRKKKCDGEQPCAMCALIGTPCLYLSKHRPHKPPTQRVRELEEQARSFRELLGRLKNEVSGSSLVEVERMLTNFDNYASDGSQAPNSPMLGVASTNPPLTSILDGRGRSLESGRTSLYFGPCSIAALVFAIIEFFDDTDATLLHPLLFDLFEKHTAAFVGLEATETLMNMGIPNQEEMITFLHTIRLHTPPSFQLIDNEEFTRILSIAYANEASNTASVELAFVHAAAALGYLLCTEQHTENSCSWNVTKSAEHYRLAIGTTAGLGVNDDLSLMVAIYLIFYNCCAHKMSEAYTMLSSTQSLIIRRGSIQTANGLAFSPGNDRVLPWKNMILTLEVIDCLVSTTLGLPRATIANAPSLLEPVIREDLGVDARLCSIYRLTSKMASLVNDIGVAISNKSTGVATKQPIDHNILEEADKILTASANTLDSIPGPREKDAHAKAPRQGLLTSFWWAELSIYSPFLHYLQPLAEGLSLPPHHSEPALKCLKAATNTIMVCEGMLRSRADSPLYMRIMHPANCGTVSSLFVSTLSLIFLICVHKGTKPPGEAWKRAEMGIRLMEALRCEAGGAGRSLAVVQEVVRQLNRFVHFDFDHIRRTTRRICSGGDDRTRSHSTFIYTEHPPMTPSAGQFQHSPAYVSNSADEMLAYARHLNRDNSEF